MLTETEKAKKAAGIKAADFVENGMIVGIGTGSTVAFFIEALSSKVQEGLKIQAVATSIASQERAAKKQIPLLPLNINIAIDLTVDGADEIDSDKNMIKGGGGALLREKLVAISSKKLLIIVDENKCVESLGRFPLPIEIISFFYLATIERLQMMGYQGNLRLNAAGTPYITDNGNYIYDIHLPENLTNFEEEHLSIKQVVGVVETGLFLNLNPQVIVGFSNNTTELLS